jgi:MoaA/NifB/PqqE/SkfB family radical SAM enzyme
MAGLIPAQVLERIWFYTNFDCALKCRYCVAALPTGGMRSHLEMPTFERILDQAVSLGFRQAALTGGEPFQHPDIADLVAYATARIDTVVLTNALLVNERLLKDLDRIKRDRLTLQVSLDSADPDVNDRRRGRGTFQKAVQGMEQLLKAGHNLTVRATLDGQSEETLGRLECFLEEMGMPGGRVYGAPVAKVGRSKRGTELSLANLCPEPTVISDGLYWHPLLIDPEMAIARRVEPLDDAVQILVNRMEQVNPVALPGVR